jgi:nucleotide-binding universal stress UspA family protein
MGRIVVGTDGSKGSHAALRWAAAEAKLRGDRLDIVVAWQVPPAAQLYLDIDLELENSSKATAEAARTLVVDELGDDAPEMHLEVRRGPAAPALLDAAADADLLVVGSHGHGAFTGLLLGSVSQHCTTHATCPVVVVRQ